MHDPRLPDRQSARLRGYDYATAGAYFVTICTQNPACLFGDEVNGEMALNLAGVVVEQWWHQIGNTFPTVVTDAFVVMPNHIHGIVFLGAQESDEGSWPNAVRRSHGAVPGPRHPMVQNRHHPRLHPRRPHPRLAPLRPPSLAT